MGGVLVNSKGVQWSHAGQSSFTPVLATHVFMKLALCTGILSGRNRSGSCKSYQVMLLQNVVLTSCQQFEEEPHRGWLVRCPHINKMHRINNDK